jgi:hypothetical protein
VYVLKTNIILNYTGVNVRPTKVKILVAGSVLDAPGDDIAKHNTCAPLFLVIAVHVNLTSKLTDASIEVTLFSNIFILVGIDPCGAKNT